MAHADGQPMGDAAASAADIQVPYDYDEDYDEAFHGPDALRGIEPEEDEDSMVSQWDEGVYTHLCGIPTSTSVLISSW